MYWVKRHDHPYTDFSTYHKCRDFKAVTTGAEENQVDMGDGWKGHLEKPEGAVELEEPRERVKTDLVKGNWSRQGSR